MLEIKNNIASSITDSDGTATISNNILNNNCFINTSNLPTGFTGTYGVDMEPNTDGLSLGAASACIGTGASLGSPYNSSINTISRTSGSGWDIGAYEYDDGSNLPNPPTNLRIVP